MGQIYGARVIDYMFIVEMINSTSVGLGWGDSGQIQHEYEGLCLVFDYDYWCLICYFRGTTADDRWL